MSDNTLKLEEVIDLGFQNPGLRGVANLWKLSTQDEYPTPATVFIDLIGYTTNEYGEPLLTMQTVVSVLREVEISYLAPALEEFASRPLDVIQFVEQLLEAEREDD